MPMPRSHSENLRQIEHLLPIVFAFLLRYLSWIQALVLAFCAVLYAVFISSKFWQATQRPDEMRRGFSLGKTVYALSVLGLILLFPNDMSIVAAVWANLSVGDAVSNLIGRNFGKKGLPWNPQKTWLGTAAAFLSSSVSAYVLLVWIGLPAGIQSVHKTACLYAAATSMVCSLAETLPLPLDDNITICLAGAAFLVWFARATWPATWNWAALGIGLGLSGCAAIIAWSLKTVSLTGVLWGGLFGSIVYFALGFPGFLLLGTFFVLGSLFSKLGYAQKAQHGLAQADQARRSGRHVWGKGGAALLAATASLFLGDKSLVSLAYVTAVATALCDTTATELGQLLGKQAILMTTLRPVAHGTPGAASLAGSLLGLLAAMVVAAEGLWFQLVTCWGATWAVVAAVIATHLEGYLVARHSGPPLSGPLMNAFHTTLSMFVALLFARIHP